MNQAIPLFSPRHLQERQREHSALIISKIAEESQCSISLEEETAEAEAEKVVEAQEDQELETAAFDLFCAWRRMMSKDESDDAVQAAWEAMDPEPKLHFFEQAAVEKSGGEADITLDVTHKLNGSTADPGTEEAARAALSSDLSRALSRQPRRATRPSLRLGRPRLAAGRAGMKAFCDMPPACRLHQLLALPVRWVSSPALRPRHRRAPFGSVPRAAVAR